MLAKLRKYTFRTAAGLLIAVTLGVGLFDALLDPTIMRGVLGIRQAVAQALLNQPTIVGKVFKQGSPPTIVGTGSPAMTAGSSDFMWEFTYGTAGSSAVLTFGSTWTLRPFCSISSNTPNSSGPPQYTVTATTVTFTGQNIGTGALVTGICMGN